MIILIVLVTSEPVLVSDNDPDPDINWWIQDLFLNQRDREVLQAGKELTDNIINAAQTLLSEQYPNLKGFKVHVLAIILTSSQYHETFRLYKYYTQVCTLL